MYVIGTLLLGWDGIACLLGLLMLLSLLGGGISVLSGLALRANRQGTRLWKHVGVLLGILSTLFVLTVGPGNYFRLIDLRSRLAVAMTGGQDQLQTWAVAVLAKPRDQMHGDGQDWIVPQEDWSDQVRRLKPIRIYIKPVFANGGEGVCLPYGSGFFHWWIVIGRPGSRPDPKFNDPNQDEWWLRWGDGIYDWQQG